MNVTPPALDFSREYMNTVPYILPICNLSRNVAQVKFEGESRSVVDGDLKTELQQFTIR